MALTIFNGMSPALNRCPRRDTAIHLSGRRSVLGALERATDARISRYASLLVECVPA